jgi:hypothetical protein
MRVMRKAKTTIITRRESRKFALLVFRNVPFGKQT